MKESSIRILKKSKRLARNCASERQEPASVSAGGALTSLLHHMRRHACTIDAVVSQEKLP
jgi:hypothetical protein